MTYVRTPGMIWPEWNMGFAAPPSLTTAVIDATGEKVAFIGRVWNKDGTTKNLTKVGFRFANVTKAGGSALTLSLQNVDLATGPPYQPDGTQDQTVALSNASITATTWYQTGSLSAARSVAFGEFLAVVIEFDGAGRLGADSFQISLPTFTAALVQVGGGASHFTSSWAAVGGANGVILEFDDGTFGMLEPGLPASAALTTTAFNSGSAADEIAMRFTVLAPVMVDGFVMGAIIAAAGADFDLVLYNGTSALATVSVDANALGTNSLSKLLKVWFPAVEITPAMTCYVAVKPTTANNVTVYDATVSTANHLQAYAGGTEWHFASRVDAGAWTAVTTRRPLGFGISVSAIHDGKAPRASSLIGM